MTAIEMPDYTEVSTQAARMQLGMEASELHGSLCGFLSGGESPGRDGWLPRVMAEPDPGAVERDSPLDRMDLIGEIAKGKVPAGLLLSQLGLRSIRFLTLVMPLALFLGLLLSIGRMARTCARCRCCLATAACRPRRSTRWWRAKASSACTRNTTRAADRSCSRSGSAWTRAP